MRNIRCVINEVLIVAFGLIAQFATSENADGAAFGSDLMICDPSSVAVSNDHQSTYCPQPYLERWRIVTDLNADGTNDLILSDTIDTFGNAGGGWMVYINSNDCWRSVGDVGLHPRAFTLDRVHDEVDLWYYSHCSSQEGHLGYYSFHKGVLKRVSERMSIRTEGEDDNVFGSIVGAVFGSVHRHPYRLDISETTTNGVVVWKTMGDWGKPSRKDEIFEMKCRLSAAENRARTAEEKLKQVSWKLERFERDLIDMSGVALGSKWEGGKGSFVCTETLTGFTNMTIAVDINGYVSGIRLIRERTTDEDGITGERFPSDEEQKIIHQAENHFHVRFALDRYPGTYRWENPFERVRIRIDFRDKKQSVIEAGYLKSFTE